MSVFGSAAGRPVACPCGSGSSYAACCGPLHRGAAAGSVEQLMRSRYSAFVLGDVDHLVRTWHPRTRPADLVTDGLDPHRRWTGLQVLGSGEDWVEFVASYQEGGRTGSMHERSRFEQRGGRWVYVEPDPRPDHLP